MNKDLRLSSEVFVSLMQTFKHNGWDIPGEDSGYESRFNRFCERLSMLNIEEQKLVIELTAHFKIIDGNDYLHELLNLLDRIGKTNDPLFQKANKFFVFPLVAPQDFKRTKSSNFVWYYFHDEHIKYHPVFIGKPIVYCDMEQVSWIKNLKSNELIILLDDYIGSGETAVDAVGWIVENYSINPSQIVVLSIASQEHGLHTLIARTGVTAYSYYSYKRGISDQYTSEQLSTYTEIMTRIESKLNVSEKYHFGYNQSEALISLIRTPNNTFPVFWKTCGKSGRNCIVPFPRD